MRADEHLYMYIVGCTFVEKGPISGTIFVPIDVFSLNMCNHFWPVTFILPH